MNQNLIFTAVIWFLTVIFFILNCVKHRRVKILSPLLLVLFVSFFALLNPSGEVIAKFGNFKVTSDSLLLGLRRSGILIGMVFLSKLIVNPGKKLHGRFGKKVEAIFYYLNQLTEKKIPLQKGHVIEAIDERLCEIWKNQTD